MTDGTDARVAKAGELRELARQFRLQAEETRLMKYVDLMRKSAVELDLLAEQIESSLAATQPLMRCG